MLESIHDTITRRYSCRTFQKEPLAAAIQKSIREYLSTLRAGPLGSRLRIEWLAATEADNHALRGLGTYGFIRGATAYIAGAVSLGPKDMEDFGYVMELAVLEATRLGVGTCWLGGTFTKSGFARKISLQLNECLPAVIAAGNPVADAPDPIRIGAGGNRRLPAQALFFEDHFDQPLLPERAGAFARPLEMVRLAPSASNKQPWRILRANGAWHFYLRRTKGYGRGSIEFRLLGLADLQRVDIGIAMAHFELALASAGLSGRWIAAVPPIPAANPSLEYIVSWTE